MAPEWRILGDLLPSERGRKRWRAQNDRQISLAPQGRAPIFAINNAIAFTFR